MGSVTRTVVNSRTLPASTQAGLETWGTGFHNRNAKFIRSDEADPDHASHRRESSAYSRRVAPAASRAATLRLLGIVQRDERTPRVPTDREEPTAVADLTRRPQDRGDQNALAGAPCRRDTRIESNRLKGTLPSNHRVTHGSPSRR